MLVACRAGDRADDSAALEAAIKDMGGEDGDGEGLVFGVGRVGPETRHVRESQKVALGIYLIRYVDVPLACGIASTPGDSLGLDGGCSGEDRHTAAARGACPTERGRAADICSHLCEAMAAFVRNPEMGCGRRIGWGLATGGGVTSPTG